MDASSTALEPSTWVLYVLRCGDGSLYCGITNNLARRVTLHQAGKGARYTRGRGPLKVIKSWPAVSMSAALKAERAFKALSKEAKIRKLRSRSKQDAISMLLKGEVPAAPRQRAKKVRIHEGGVLSKQTIAAVQKRTSRRSQTAVAEDAPSPKKAARVHHAGGSKQKNHKGPSARASHR